MSSGRFIKTGTKLGTTYPENGKGMNDLIQDFYGSTFAMYKSAGAPTYMARDAYPTANGTGYFNAIMGKEVTAAMFATDNIYTAIGARPYQHEGVRIAPELADYGLDASGNFAGIGAGTIQDGKIPTTVAMPIDEFRQPYKELPFAFDYGLGLQALEHKEDDTIQYKAYVEKMAVNYSDLIDKTLLRPITRPQPTQGTDLTWQQYHRDSGAYNVETSLNGIARCICSGKEATTDTDPTTLADVGTAISTGMVSPYGGKAGDFHRVRGYNNGGTSHTENNYDGNVFDLNGGSLSISDFKKLYRTCSVNWADQANPKNKVFAMSNIAQDKLAALMAANNVLLGTEYISRDFNGVSSIPGRDVGLLVNSFQNIPIMQDGNFNFDFTTKRVSAVKYGDVMLLDLDHIWMSILTPVEMYNVDNPLITGALREKNLMTMRAELRIDSFIQHGRIKNIADDATI